MGKGSSGSGAGATERVFAALDGFRIEVPSWGFANTGTRFGKFSQAGAATSLEEKFEDAGQVNKLTGASPSVALHVLWDLPNGKGDVPELKRLEKKYGVKSGAVNPNLFQAQEYKYGSIANPSAEIRKHAVAHLLDSVEIGKALGNKDVSIWLADGSNYPGTQSMLKRIEWLEEALGKTHAALGANQRMLVEYKPFEPAFYHTDIADWGMALSLARKAGPKAKVLVDTGHHLPGCNIEQIVTWLLHLNALGGFHFNDRKFADDDLTLGSIDPYQLFAGDSADAGGAGRGVRHCQRRRAGAGPAGERTEEQGRAGAGGVFRRGQAGVGDRLGASGITIHAMMYARIPVPANSTHSTHSSRTVVMSHP